MSIYNVPRLETLASKVSYKQVLSTLTMSWDRRPKGTRFPWKLSSLFISADSYLTLEARELVKSLLNRHLVGTMSEAER